MSNLRERLAHILELATGHIEFIASLPDLLALAKDQQARIERLESALRVFVDKYEAAGDCDLGCGLVNGDFFRAKEVLNG